MPGQFNDIAFNIGVIVSAVVIVVVPVVVFTVIGIVVFAALTCLGFSFLWAHSMRGF